MGGMERDEGERRGEGKETKEVTKGRMDEGETRVSM